MARGMVWFAISGDLDQRTGGYLYDKRLAQELAALGWHVAPLQLDGSFPHPTPAALASAGAALAGLPGGALVLVDGLAFGVMPEIARAEAARLRLIALVHHPLGYEAGLDAGTAARLVESERSALAHCRAVIVTSATTRETLVAEFGVPPDRITVAEPGTDPMPVAPGSGTQEPALLAVGAVTPRKDFPTLIRALAPSRELGWRLAIAGSLTRDPAAAAALSDVIARHDLADRVTLLGELDATALKEAYGRSDLFVSSSVYEGYGMAAAEAVASGLPIVAVAGGALADWLDGESALLVPPGDRPALTEALRSVLLDPVLRTALRAGALAARSRLAGWPETAGKVAELLQRVAAV
jgi:glycosyltransferase involved in cell wall biosynthesis